MERERGRKGGRRENNFSLMKLFWIVDSWKSKIISPQTKAHSCAHRSWTQTSITYIVGLFLCYRLLQHKKCPGLIRTPVSQAAVGPWTQGGLYRWNATQLHPEMCISRLHISLYKNASMVFACGRSLLQDELGKLTRSLFTFDYAEEFLCIFW